MENLIRADGHKKAFNIEEHRIFECNRSKTCKHINRCFHSKPHLIAFADCGILPTHICEHGMRNECVQIRGPVSEFKKTEDNYDYDDSYSTPLGNKVDRVTSEEWKKIRAKRKAKQNLSD